MKDLDISFPSHIIHRLCSIGVSRRQIIIVWPVHACELGGTATLPVFRISKISGQLPLIQGKSIG